MKRSEFSQGHLSLTRTYLAQRLILERRITTGLFSLSRTRTVKSKVAAVFFIASKLWLAVTFGNVTFPPLLHDENWCLLRKRRIVKLNLQDKLNCFIWVSGLQQRMPSQTWYKPMNETILAHIKGLTEVFILKKIEAGQFKLWISIIRPLYHLKTDKK